MRLIDENELLKDKVDNAYIYRFEIELAPTVNALVLPCEVGTKIYVAVNYPAYYNNIEETTITGVSQFLYDNRTISNQITTSMCLWFDWEKDFGKIIFLTREAAEKALKGGATNV